MPKSCFCELFHEADGDFEGFRLRPRVCKVNLLTGSILSREACKFTNLTWQMFPYVMEESSVRLMLGTGNAGKALVIQLQALFEHNPLHIHLRSSSWDIRMQCLMEEYGM